MRFGYSILVLANLILVSLELNGIQNHNDHGNNEAYSTYYFESKYEIRGNAKELRDTFHK
jgi:hypothetical protein